MLVGLEGGKRAGRGERRRWVDMEWVQRFGTMGRRQWNRIVNYGQREKWKSQTTTKEVNNGYCDRDFVWIICAMSPC